MAAPGAAKIFNMWHRRRMIDGGTMLGRKMILPPYGKMGDGYWDAMAAENIPPDWLPEDPRRSDKWVKWLGDLRATIADHIWPAFDPVTTTWKGLAVDFAEELTRAELVIMMDHFQGNPKTLDKKPASPRPSASLGNHLHYFKAEDGTKPFGSYHADYDAKCPDWLAATVPSLMRTALTQKVASGILFLKSEFVRTRPYQASMIMGMTKFRSQTAATSLTSSIFSGHALQGIMAGCAVFDLWSKTALVKDDVMVTCLAQHAVDIGDRRVFAGVHFPCDNVASWIIALNLIPHVFDEPAAVARFACTAIRDRSEVFRILEMVRPGTRTLSEPMRALEVALSGGSG